MTTSFIQPHFARSSKKKKNINNNNNGFLKLRSLAFREVPPLNFILRSSMTTKDSIVLYKSAFLSLRVSLRQNLL